MKILHTSVIQIVDVQTDEATTFTISGDKATGFTIKVTSDTGPVPCLKLRGLNLDHLKVLAQEIIRNL